MREFQRDAVRLHIRHHAAEEEIHGAWMTEELARHGHRISPGTGKQVLAADRGALKEPAREVLGDDAP
ncbi:hypothetical protein [Streptomyces sp. NPDC001657]|uniref:hypothetical protein n=1 Tax=unclassified Streptomyces TaxID=2593676 RepID=UPI003316E87F